MTATLPQLADATAVAVDLARLFAAVALSDPASWANDPRVEAAGGRAAVSLIDAGFELEEAQAVLEALCRLAHVPRGFSEARGRIWAALPDDRLHSPIFPREA